MKKINKQINKKGFVLLETVIVAVFVISIFTFIYLSVVPLLGRYEELSYEYDIDVAYKLYHIRDAIYKDNNFEEIIGGRYGIITSNDFDDLNYYNSLTGYLFEEGEYQIVYARKLESRVNAVVSGLGLSAGFGDYIKKVAQNNTSENFQNFIFLKEGNNYAYLGLATNLSDTTNYEDPIVIDNNNHADTSNANKPVMMDGMIPVYYSEDDGSWHKADMTNKSDYHYWYDYNDQMWANVVMVKENVRSNYQTAEVGEVINISDVVAFYVWIPRYEYYIHGDFGLGSDNASLPGEISVNFIASNATKQRVEGTNTWRTATAFTFGSEELAGFWFAKFEPSNSELQGFSSNGEGVPYILPETYSWTGRKIATIYNNIKTYMNGTNGEAIYGLVSSSLTSDAHAMKNDEWGAVAYLSQSKYGKYGNDDFAGTNKEVYINNRTTSSADRSVVTGSSAGEPSVSTTAAVSRECASTSSNTSAQCYKYYVPVLGTGASTSGTVYGVYDMSGGITEMVMGATGVTTARCGSKIYVGAYEEFTGFKGPYGAISATCNSDENDLDFPTDTKYYNFYFNNVSSTLKSCGTSVLSSKICYSHAMGETLKWYDDVAEPINGTNSWYVRGGTIEVSSGIFAITFYNLSRSDGSANTLFTSRPTIAVYNAND